MADVLVVQSKEIDVFGGKISVGEYCKILFPVAAVVRKTRFTVTVRKPTFCNEKFPVTPIIELTPSQSFIHPVTIYVQTWRQMIFLNPKSVSVDIHGYDGNRCNFGQVSLQSENWIEFKTTHFSKFVTSLSEPSSSEIQLVSYLFYLPERNRLVCCFGVEERISAYQDDIPDKNYVVSYKTKMNVCIGDQIKFSCGFPDQDTGPVTRTFTVSKEISISNFSFDVDATLQDKTVNYKIFINGKMFHGSEISLSIPVPQDIPDKLERNTEPRTSIVKFEGQVNMIGNTAIGTENFTVAKHSTCSYEFNCCECKQAIASSEDLVYEPSNKANFCFNHQIWEKKASIVQRLKNPFGYQFDVVTFKKANCDLRSKPSAFYTWFTGYKWIICCCIHCDKHVGWKFVSDEQSKTPFYGLIFRKTG